MSVSRNECMWDSRWFSGSGLDPVIMIFLGRWWEGALLGILMLLVTKVRSEWGWGSDDIGREETRNTHVWPGVALWEICIRTWGSSDKCIEAGSMETFSSRERGLSLPHSLKVSLLFAEDCSGRTWVSLCLLHCVFMGQLHVREKWRKHVETQAYIWVLSSLVDSVGFVPDPISLQDGFFDGESRCLSHFTHLRWVGENWLGT